MSLIPVAIAAALCERRSPLCASRAPGKAETRRQGAPSQLPLITPACPRVIPENNFPGDKRCPADGEDWLSIMNGHSLKLPYSAESLQQQFDLAIPPPPMTPTSQRSVLSQAFATFFSCAIARQLVNSIPP